MRRLLGPLLVGVARPCLLPRPGRLCRLPAGVVVLLLCLLRWPVRLLVGVVLRFLLSRMGRLCRLPVGVVPPCLPLRVRCRDVLCRPRAVLPGTRSPEPVRQVLGVPASPASCRAAINQVSCLVRGSRVLTSPDSPATVACRPPISPGLFPAVLVALTSLGLFLVGRVGGVALTSLDLYLVGRVAGVAPISPGLLPAHPVAGVVLIGPAGAGVPVPMSRTRLGRMVLLVGAAMPRRTSLVLAGAVTPRPTRPFPLAAVMLPPSRPGATPLPTRSVASRPAGMRADRPEAPAARCRRSRAPTDIPSARAMPAPPRTRAPTPIPPTVVAGTVFRTPDSSPATTSVTTPVRSRLAAPAASMAFPIPTTKPALDPPAAAALPVRAAVAVPRILLAAVAPVPRLVPSAHRR